MGAMPVEDEFLEDLVADFRLIQVRSRSFLIPWAAVSLCFYSMVNYNRSFLIWRNGKA